MSFTFGAPPATASATNTATNPPSTFSFGNNASNQNIGSSSFSSNFASTASTQSINPTSSGLSSTQPVTTQGNAFSFGSQPTSSSSSFSFGSQPATSSSAINSASQPTTSSSAFSFGSQPTTSSSAFSFGSQPATSSSSFSFGAQPTTSSAAPTFSFGSNPTAASKSFAFGSTTSSMTTATTAPTTTFSFGSNNALTSKPSSFPQGTSTLGFGANTTLGGTAPSWGQAPANNSSVANTTPIVMHADPAVSQLNTIKSAYHDISQSRFKFLMYNAIDPVQRHLYVRPPYISERLWNQAEMDNPDPLHYAPVPIIGFDNLLKRIKIQQDYASKYDQYTRDLTSQMQEMEKSSRRTEEKLEECRRRHLQLFHKLVRVMKDLEFLQNFGKPPQTNEAELALALEKLHTLIHAPGQYKARMEEVMSLRQLYKAKPPAPPPMSLPSDDLQRVHKFLDMQRQSLEHLTTILNDDVADIKMMKDMWRR